ncbi:Mbov_0396 family ICE element transmembrane protein [Mesomycoplasma ovipneumoniae]|uniref:Mbov_0396 family ICE element transmembrane protein n=1 Tax=Mesomycoplasma ovipneumoniae TaxID=29562 RepID=UPI003080341B
MFGWLINAISYGFFAVGWYIFCWFPLIIIKVITTLFGAINFNLLKGIFFGQQEIDVNKIPVAFWIFVGLSAGALVFLIFYRLLKGFFYNSEQKTGQSEIKSIILKTISAIFFPIIFVGFLFIVLVGSNIVLMEIKASFSQNQDLNVSLIRGATGDLNLNAEQIKSISGGSIVSFSFYENFEWGQGPKLILLVLISSLTIAWLLGTTLTSLVANIAQMFYQLILLPVFSVSQLTDDGKLFKKYLNGFWAKFWVVIIYQIAFLFFFVWTEYSINAWDFIKTSDTDFGGLANWILSFVFSLVMILGGGIAIKTISQEFAGYFGGEGFIRSQQEWANRTAVGVSATAGLLATAPTLGRKIFRKGARLTGYYDSAKTQIKDDYRAGRINNTERKLRLNELANRKVELGQTFRQGWEKSKDIQGNKFTKPIKRLLAAKKAFKESKDMGIIEGKMYDISKKRSKWADRKHEEATKNLSDVNQQMLKIDPNDENQKQNWSSQWAEAVVKENEASKNKEKRQAKFAKRSKNLYNTVQIPVLHKDPDYRKQDSYKQSYDYKIVEKPIEDAKKREESKEKQEKRAKTLEQEPKNKEQNNNISQEKKEKNEKTDSE